MLKNAAKIYLKKSSVQKLCRIFTSKLCRILYKGLHIPIDKLKFKCYYKITEIRVQRRTVLRYLLKAVRRFLQEVDMYASYAA